MNSRLKVFLPVFSLIATLLTSCKDEEEPIPAYVHIPEFRLATQPGEGTDSENITVVWVYVNNDFLGGYELPATFPVLASGQVELVLQAGVKENGISLLPGIYPFYERIESVVVLQAAKVDTFRPLVRYDGDTRFSLLEDFNLTSHLFTDDLDSNPDSKIEITDEGAFEGLSARIRLNETTKSIIVGTDFNKLALENIPKNNIPVWMELNYKNDIPMTFGITSFDQFGNPTPYPEFGINPRASWNKIYLNLTDFVQNTNTVGYQIFLTASLPAGVTRGEIYLDNIKLVHF